MGGILSRPVVYVKNKVNDTKQAITNKVSDTKQAIVTKVTDVRDGIVGKVRRKRDAVCNKVNRGCLAVYNGVNNTGQAIVTRVTNTRDYVCDTAVSAKNRVVAVKDGVVTKVNNTIATVVHVKDVVVGTCLSGVQSGRNRYINARSAINARYTNAKNSVYQRYRYYRDRKYSRSEKFLIALVSMLLFFAAIVTLLCVFDIYQGRPDLAEERLRVVAMRTGEGVAWIWDTLGSLANQAWRATRMALYYTWEGLRLAGYYFWEGTMLVAHYVWLGLKMAALYTYQYSAIAMEKAAMVSKVIGVYLWEGSKVMAVYIGAGLQVTAQYVLMGSKIAGEHVVFGVKQGAHYTYQGTAIAGEYGAAGFKYSLRHGAGALKQLSVKSVQWAWYFLTNFRAASYDSALCLWETSKWVVANLWLGSREGSHIAWQGSKSLANATYHGTIYSGKVTAHVLKTTYHYAVWGVKESLSGGISVTNATWYITKTTVSTVTWAVKTASTEITSFTVDTTLAVYNGTCALSRYLYASTVTVSRLLWDWLTCGCLVTARFVSVAVREHLFVWLCALLTYVAEWTVIIATILWTFLRDLNLVLVRLVVAVGTQVYNVVYIVVGFLYQIVSTVTLVVKLVVKGLVYCVTSVFGGVIWVLEEFMFGYTFVLHKYNMYREVLFIGVMGLIVAYCSGLIQDNARQQESEETDSEDDHTDWIQEVPGHHGTQEVPGHHGKKEVRAKKTEDVGAEHSGICEAPANLKLGESSPKTVRFRESKKQPPPTYVARSAIPHYTDELLSDDSDLDFSLDPDVPDFMQLTDSDPEPPTPDDPPPAIELTSSGSDPQLASSNGEKHDSEFTAEYIGAIPNNQGVHQGVLEGHKADLEGHEADLEGHKADLDGHEADLEDSESSDLEVCDLKDSGVETS